MTERCPQTTRLKCASCGMQIKAGERLRVIVGNATLHEVCLEKWLIKRNLALSEENRRLRQQLQAAASRAGFPPKDRVA